jgi:lipopolysaccharide/colanic/teichoic acid biosynthesis glycosyltransferase
MIPGNGRKNGHGTSRTCYALRLKRPLDFLLALFFIALLSPVLLITALLVRLRLGSPVLFRQQRPGLNEDLFTIYKFRTMNDQRDENGTLLPDSRRLTNFGRFLRSASLDELPELLNILKGDMSFVGPRPLSVRYLPFYTPEERRRHSVRPGLTGLAQVNGRNSLSWEDKFRFDLEYIDSISFRGDIRILLRTVSSVFDRSGIGQAEEAPESLHIIRRKNSKSSPEEAS